MNFITDQFYYKNNACIIGLTKELSAFYVLHLFEKEKKSIIVLANTLYEANQYYDLLSSYSNDVYFFPMDDFLTSVAVAVSPELKIKRLETLELIKQNPAIVVTNLMGYLRFLPDKEKREFLSIALHKGDVIVRDKFLQVLEQFGYHRESVVTTTGEYAVRGFVVDVFPIELEHPIRIEFFGDEIESLRFFQESSQLSFETISDIEILPFKEVKTKKNSSLFDYLDKPAVFYLDYSQIKAGYAHLQEEIFHYQTDQNTKEKYMFAWEDISACEEYYLSFHDDYVTEATEKIVFQSQEIDHFQNDFKVLKASVLGWNQAGKKVLFCLDNEKEIKTIQHLFEENTKKLHHFGEELGMINVICWKLTKGFLFQNYVVISSSDIEKTNQAKVHYKNTYRIGRKIKDLEAISPGDYVVHLAHGIGIYRGVMTLTKNGLKKDYLQIDYDGNDKVYIPVEKVSTIYKYASKEGTKPKINKLNSPSWAKTKHSLQKKLEDISQELLLLYAQRAQIQGMVCQDDPMEELFAQEFMYELTADQEKAIRDIDKDLNSPVPMDRLLCGDVGFGKTEVAFRAMFKVLINHHQVAYLCPTTILSKQQYYAAKERFRSFPVEIALLNRFTSAKEVTRILEGLKKSSIDMVFGTHRLLSSDVSYKNLGLLVVDEEQRFGVTHKEKIKQLKNDVNVLTLSATPIPRTMKMALSGLRDLSIIDTPPVNRYPIQTYVLMENDGLVKEAIYKELSRHGQIFILYNKVESITQKVDAIRTLVPEAKITYAHGQMSKIELENVMQSFVNHEYDILVCTTIIETGIDIANANTLIIYDADHFGLSQLYQIRGRVGRSNKIAYAYLMYNQAKILNEIAVKRLEAIKEFTELGSGYRIAMRDLSIRGAGDILGSEQAGFVDSVGIELYMQLLDLEIRKQRGEEILEEEDSNSSLIDVETHISDSYVNEEELKIEIHKKINEIDSYEKMLEIKNEIEDRFGKITENIEIYMYEEWFEKLAQKLGITKVMQNERYVEVELPVETSNQVKADKLFLKAYNIAPKIQFKYVRQRIVITLFFKDLTKHFLYFLVPILEEVFEEIKNK